MENIETNKWVILAAGAPAAIEIVQFSLNMVRTSLTMTEFVRLLLTLALCYHLYVGKLWARNLALVLCTCAEIMAIIFAIHTFAKYDAIAYPVILPFGFMIAYTLLLTLPKSVKEHFNKEHKENYEEM